MRSILTILISVALLIAVSPGYSLDKLQLEQLGMNEEAASAAQGTDWKHPGLSGGTMDPITWNNLPDAPVTVCRAAIGRIGNYVYIFGGQGTGGGSTALAFNLTTLQWETSTTPTITGANWSAAVVGDSILYLWPTTLSTTIQAFTPTGGGPTGVWSYVAEYPITTCMNAIAWDGGNYIYSACSFISNQDLAYRFNLSTQSFEQIANLPAGRGFGGGAFVNGKFYVLGGTDTGNNYTNTTYEYDPGTNSWTSRALMIKASSFNCFNTATDGNMIYLVGGGGGNATSIPATDTVQVYNTTTDTWAIETPRWSATTGTNAACYVEAEHYLIDCGGRDLSTTYYNTFRGDLPGGPTNFRLTLTPHNPPIQIPAGGGSFNFDATIENNLPNSMTLDAWTDVVLPNGAHYGPLVLRTNVLFPAGATLMRTLGQNVPAAAPPGNYTYWGYVGVFPDSVFRSDSFDFSKLAGDAVPNHNQEWECYGWLGDETALTATPTQFILGGASPNPFNPTTTISFTLPETGKVTLSVFDITGREAARLVEGEMFAGHHNVVFDGTGLASGVYFYKLTADGVSDVRKMILVK